MPCRQVQALVVLLVFMGMGCVGNDVGAEKTEIRSRHPLTECGSEVEVCIATLSSHVRALKKAATNLRLQEAVLSSGRLPPTLRAERGSFSKVARWSQQIGHYCGKVKLIASQLLTDLHPVREPDFDYLDGEDATPPDVTQGEYVPGQTELDETLNDDLRGEGAFGATEEEREIAVIDQNIDGDWYMEPFDRQPHFSGASVEGETSHGASGAGAEGEPIHHDGVGNVPRDTRTGHEAGDSGGARSRVNADGYAGSSCSYDAIFEARDIFITKLEMLHWIMFSANEIEEGSADTSVYLHELEIACTDLLTIYREDADMLDTAYSPREGSSANVFGAGIRSDDIDNRVAKFTEAIRAAVENSGIDFKVVADRQYFDLGSDGRLRPVSDTPLAKEEEVLMVVQELANAEARVEQQQQHRNLAAAETTPSKDEKLVERLTEKLLDMWESEEYNEYIQVYSLSSDQSDNVTTSLGP